jgi:hypothetical protein
MTTGSPSLSALNASISARAMVFRRHTNARQVTPIRYVGFPKRTRCVDWKVIHDGVVTDLDRWNRAATTTTTSFRSNTHVEQSTTDAHSSVCYSNQS